MQMLNLQFLQRERVRLYKNDLRRQYEEKQQMRKNQSMQIKSRDQESLKQKVEIAMKQMHQEKQRDFILKNKLKRDNLMLASLKHSNKQIELVKQEAPLKGISLLQTLYKQQQRRGSQFKNIAKKLSQEYSQEESVRFDFTQLHKVTSKQLKNYELFQDQQHMERLKQTEALRRQQHEDIKNRHSPEPKVGELHKRLQELNDEYRKQSQSFAYNGRDILDVLKRDQSKQAFERNRRVQFELKHQMEEKKIKDGLFKQQYLGGPDDLKKSILGSILFKSPNYDKKQYANYLIKQINETDFKKHNQKTLIKQRVEVASIFGGNAGPERLKMIKYIDRNLGIQSEYLKSIESGSKPSSPSRIKKLCQCNGESLPKKAKLQHQDKQQTLYNPQKIHTEAAPKSQSKQKSVQSSNEHAIRLSSSKVEDQSPKFYLGYDLIKGSQYRYQV